MASLGVISLGRVQSDGTESASELFGEIPVVATDLSDHGSEDFDGLDDDVKDLKRGEGWSGLHALPSDRTVTAPRGESSRSHGRWRGSFAPGVQAKPPDSDSDFRLGFRKSDFRPRTPTSDPELGRGLPTRTGKTDSDLRLRTSALRLRVRLPVREGTRLRRPPPPAAERLRSVLSVSSPTSTPSTTPTPSTTLTPTSGPDIRPTSDRRLGLPTSDSDFRPRPPTRIRTTSRSGREPRASRDRPRFEERELQRLL